MSYKRPKELDARDKCIVRLFYDCLHAQKLSAMAAYSYCAETYDITEDQVRRIIRKSAKSGQACPTNRKV